MKVQSYSNASTFEKKSIPFLIRRESLNNIFWEVFKKIGKPNGNIWMGNVFYRHRVGLSAAITRTSYLFLSAGEKSCVDSLVKYGKRKKWKLKGVTGPNEEIDRFYLQWTKKTDYEKNPKDKVFSIFESTASKQKVSLDFTLKKVDPVDWPRVRLWTKQFAAESIPYVNELALVRMAKDMMNENSLYVLRNKDNASCAMGGFGRTTPNKLIINLVFVPADMRRRGFATELVKGLLSKSKSHGYKHSVLFSDYERGNNLYETIGFQKVGKFCERTFE